MGLTDQDAKARCQRMAKTIREEAISKAEEILSEEIPLSRLPHLD